MHTNWWSAVAGVHIHLSMSNGHGLIDQTPRKDPTFISNAYNMHVTQIYNHVASTQW